MQSAERHLRTLAAASGHRSLRALALAAHIDRLTLRLALRGERTPRRDTLDRLARTLNVDAATLRTIFAGARGAA